MSFPCIEAFQIIKSNHMSKQDLHKKCCKFSSKTDKLTTEAKKVYIKMSSPSDIFTSILSKGISTTTTASATTDVSSITSSITSGHFGTTWSLYDLTQNIKDHKVFLAAIEKSTNRMYALDTHFFTGSATSSSELLKANNLISVDISHATRMNIHTIEMIPSMVQKVTDLLINNGIPFDIINDSYSITTTGTLVSFLYAFSGGLVRLIGIYLIFSMVLTFTGLDTKLFDFITRLSSSSSSGYSVQMNKNYNETYLPSKRGLVEMKNLSNPWNHQFLPWNNHRAFENQQKLLRLTT